MIKETNKEYSFKDFVYYVVGFDVIAIIFAFYPVYHTYGLGYVTSGILSLVITSLNFLGSYFIIYKFADSDAEVFMRAILGSVAARLILLILIIIGVILLIKIDRFSFIICLFISYIYKSVIEIYFLSKKGQIRHYKTTSD